MSLCGDWLSGSLRVLRLSQPVVPARAIHRRNTGCLHIKVIQVEDIPKNGATVLTMIHNVVARVGLNGSINGVKGSCGMDSHRITSLPLAPNFLVLRPRMDALDTYWKVSDGWY